MNQGEFMDVLCHDRIALSLVGLVTNVFHAGEGALQTHLGQVQSLTINECSVFDMFRWLLSSSIVLPAELTASTSSPHLSLC